MAAATPESKAPLQRDRQPFNSFTKKLEVHGDIPGYHLYWFADDGDRITKAQAGGYMFVNRKELGVNDAVTPGNNAVDDKVRRLGGKLPNGEAMYMYLMKIPEELWQEDQKSLEAHNDRITQAIRAGAVGNTESGKSYVDGTPMTGKGVQYDPKAKAAPLATPSDFKARV